MDPASLSLSVLVTFKEVYLISKFIYKTAASAKHSSSEQRTLLSEFHYEFLYLQSFRQVLLLHKSKVVQEDQLNKEWLWQCGTILEQLRLLFADYAKVAAELDDDYNKFSPYKNDQYARTAVIEFPLMLENVSQPSEAVVSKSIFSAISFGLKNAFKGPLYEKNAWRWALFQRDRLQRTLDEFQRWNQKLKDLVPLLLASNPQFRHPDVLSELQQDKDADVNGLSQHIRLVELADNPEKDPTDFDRNYLALLGAEESSTLTMANVLDRQKQETPKENVLIEYKYYAKPQAKNKNRYGSERQVHQLASLLAASGSYNFHTLPFKGYINQEAKQRYAFLFGFPSETAEAEPVSLHDQIRASARSFKGRIELPTRFRIAHTIAKQLGAFHADGWVHKSVRSQSIKFFSSAQGEVDFQRPFLVDFEFSRPETMETQNTYDTDFERNIYRHPDRQGPPNVSFNKMHDIYALGVVLLEIGTWQTARSIYDEACGRMKKGVAINPRGVQNLFTEQAKRRLAYFMGPAYCDAVVACLSNDSLLKEFINDSRFAMKFQQLVVENVDSRRMAEMFK